MFDEIAERKIAEAIARGELDDLPGAGRPLELDDDRLIPGELRMAYRILKNAGYAPAEVQALAPEDERLRVLDKMARLRMAAESRAGRRPASTSRRRG
jgi:hypothetical protein